MAFSCVIGDSTAIPMYCATSSTVTKGSLLTFDRSNGKVIIATASLLAEDVAGVASNTPSSADEWVNVIPVRNQVWEWDCTNNTATNQLCKRSVLTDSLTVANTSTDQAVDEVVVEPYHNVGAAANKKQRGRIVMTPATLS